MEPSPLPRLFATAYSSPFRWACLLAISSTLAGSTSQPKDVRAPRNRRFSNIHTTPCLDLPNLLAASLVVSHRSNSRMLGIFPTYLLEPSENILHDYLP